MEDARSFILYQRLTQIPVIRITFFIQVSNTESLLSCSTSLQKLSKWLENDELNYRNSNLEGFFKKDWDGNEIIKRMNEFNRNVQNDLDRVRLNDRCTLPCLLLLFSF